MYVNGTGQLGKLATLLEMTVNKVNLIYNQKTGDQIQNHVAESVRNLDISSWAIPQGLAYISTLYGEQTVLAT